MEKEIGAILDNLTIDQTERLLEDTMEMKISGKDRNRVKDSVFAKIGSKKKVGIYLPKKLVACVASVAIIFASLSIVGFDNVAAAMSKIFSFIPGVGITEKSDAAIYALNPVVGRLASGNAKANLVSAVYADGYLTVTVEVLGKAVYSDGFKFYSNQNELSLKSNFFGLAVASDSSMLNFSHETNAPTSDDIYEIAVAGFSERLSFKMAPCNDYDDIREIGPTDIQNGISITTTAQKIENQLVVWCYPFNSDKAAKDEILGIGQPSNGSFVMERYIQTQSGQIASSTNGWGLRNRLVFDVSGNDESATLHIPYLSMQRAEKNKLNINLPKDYTTAESIASIDCSLGTIRVTEVKREPNEYENGKDTIWIKFAFDSKDSNKALYSFNFQTTGNYASNTMHFNVENGSLEYLEVYVDKNTNKVSLDMTDLYYYLLGEYTISLDIR